MKLFPGKEPCRALEEHRESQNDVVDGWVFDCTGVKQMFHAFVDRDPRTHRKDEDGDDEAPKVDLLAMAKGKAFVRWPCRTPQAEKQQDLVSGVDDRVDALGEHR